MVCAMDGMDGSDEEGLVLHLANKTIERDEPSSMPVRKRSSLEIRGGLSTFQGMSAELNDEITKALRWFKAKRVNSIKMLRTLEDLVRAQAPLRVEEYLAIVDALETSP